MAQEGEIVTTTLTSAASARRDQQPRRQNNNNNNNEEADAAEMAEEVEELELKYGAAHVIKLFIPVTICLVFVIVSLTTIKSYQKSGGQTLLYTPFNENSEQATGTKLWMSVANASIFICVVVVMTVVLILLYKYRCYKIIHGWLAFSSLMLLFFFTYMFVGELCKEFNWVWDMLTVCLLLWNFGVLGMFCIHWKGPLVLQQVFLIFTCVQMALIFIKYLPEWTTWVLLAFISVWDLIAVLCPFGPLRILVETARSRNDNLFPAMVYSSTVMYMITATMGEEGKSDEKTTNGDNNLEEERLTPAAGATEEEQEDDGGFEEQRTNPTAASFPSYGTTTNTGENSAAPAAARNRLTNQQVPGAAAAQAERAQQLEIQEEEEEDNGVKLGLGDFIFYSILVGKASILGDWNTVIACFLAILIGLCLTLVLLAIFHKPLPALPISLLFGLIFYFLTNLIVRPFYDQLTYNQFFI